MAGPTRLRSFGASAFAVTGYGGTARQARLESSASGSVEAGLTARTRGRVPEVLRDQRRYWNRMAGPTRLELATSGVTGRRSDQLNYDPARSWGAGVRPRKQLSIAALDGSVNGSWCLREGGVAWMGPPTFR